jgi:formylmethanofuran dehydrogenase subunit E
MQAIIACAPVKPIPGTPPYPNTDYEQVACPLCSELMYLGPRSKERHERDGTPIVCMPCAVKHGAMVVPDNVTHLGGR